MRKITLASVSAFMAGQPFSSGNMYVSQHTASDGEHSSLYLHDNLIAEKIGIGPDYDVVIRDAGWQSDTTKERLNGLLNFLGLPRFIYSRDFAWFINGEDWEGAARIVVRSGVVERIESTRDNGDVIRVPLLPRG